MPYVLNIITETNIALSNEKTNTEMIIRKSLHDWNM
jgi:hypothetical protein